MSVEHIHWLGHASFRLDGVATVYIDPWKLAAGSPPAGLILITHEHSDHARGAARFSAKHACPV